MARLELRTLPLTLETRNDSDTLELRGHAAVCNSLSEDLGGFYEEIAPGAFKDALLKSDVRALFNHDPNFVLGRQSAGTLKVSEDEKGLYSEIFPPDTTWARDLLSSIKRRDIREMSFGFIVARSTWSERSVDSKIILVRTITEFEEIFDVSPVTYPAYGATSISERSMPEYRSISEIRSEYNPAPTLRRHINIMRRRLDLITKEDMKYDFAGKN